MTAEERFWSKVDCSGGDEACWPWMGYCNPKGYGMFRAASGPVLAHRFAWETANGPIPSGVFACHTCDNPPCCNPAHLFVAVAAGNTADMMAKGRHGSYVPTPPRGGQWRAAHPVIARGEAIGTAKLTEAAVRDIRERRSNGETFKAIGLWYGVSPSTIHRVAMGVGWRHV